MKCVFVYLFSFIIFLVSAQVEEIITGNNRFASSLSKIISKNETNNFLVSPFSAEIIFALVQSGANGKTAKELQDHLYLPQDQTKTKTAIRTLLHSILNDESDDYSFLIANKIYVQANFQIKEDFQKTATDDFYCEVENVDFLKKEETINNVNKWVEKHTNNKIHNLLGFDAIDDNTRAVLVNALYFQAPWRKPFLDEKTKNKNFYVDTLNVIQVPTMHQEGFYNYYEHPELNATFLEIPLEPVNTSIVFVLPNKNEGLVSLENQIEKVFEPPEFIIEAVDVAIPKFKIESSFDLKEILMKMGVIDVFGDQADLSGISNTALYISKAAQKTFISVQEKGIEAAAASYAVANQRIAFYLPPTTKSFHLDHPFIFYIKVKDVIVFSGKVRSPVNK